MHEDLARLNFDRDIALMTPVFLANRKWTINSSDFPTLDVTLRSVRPLRLRVDCSQWDELPPAIVLLEASGEPMRLPGAVSIFNSNDHPSRPGPFVCMRGVREWHTHPSHNSDSWENYRGLDGMNLPGILDQVFTAWRKLGAA